MSKTFAIFLLENANNGNEILAVLDDIVEVKDTVLLVTIKYTNKGRVVDTLPFICYDVFVIVSYS